MIQGDTGHIIMVMARVCMRGEEADSTVTQCSPDLKNKQTRTFCPVLKVTVGQEMPSHRTSCAGNCTLISFCMGLSFRKEKPAGYCDEGNKLMFSFSSFVCAGQLRVNHVRVLTATSKPKLFLLWQVGWLIRLQSDWEVLVLELYNPDQVV